ncbi:hypothetical protein BC938DRAFT_476843 [Jimgerdemannia flammicorona]|uniref:Uncharacterized protein n=1 Tax=Jimgerdemannia flammicorona TaxID=994334 RepID=A0A433QQ13_9FUNG|nr:hypothetical protein BC938DRAFT_476843 [Jimgerdemannia flammicorona]
MGNDFRAPFTRTYPVEATVYRLLRLYNSLGKWRKANPLNQIATALSEKVVKRSRHSNTETFRHASSL